MKRFLLLLAFMALSVIPAHAQLWSGVLPSPQGINWQNAGVDINGTLGIPTNYTQCGSTVAAGASAATVQADIQACNGTAPCTSGKYVLLGPGNFSFSTGITWNGNCVILRGSGPNSTFITFSGGGATCLGTSANFCIAGSLSYYMSPQNLATWSAGYTQGTTTITLSSTSNLSVGTPIALDQTDDTSDSGDIFVCSETTPIACSLSGEGGGSRSGRAQQQIVTVTQCDSNTTFGHSCSSGANITISPGLYMPNWASGKTPQAWWATTTLYGDGIQYFSANYNGSTAVSGVEFFNATNGFEQGVTSIGNTGRFHAQMFQVSHISVVDNYFYLQGPSASVNYGVSPIPCSDCLVQNNIFERIQAPYPSDGPCSGCVFAYNFDVNNYFQDGTGHYLFQNQSGFPHDAGDDHFLYEGNIGAGIYADNFHGTHHFVTAYRNYWNGYQQDNGSSPTSATIPLLYYAYSRFYNVIGNVLGSTQLCPSGCNYQAVTSGGPSTNVMYVLGFGSSPVAFDSNVQRTIFRWGNYDVVSAAIRWCGNSSDTGWVGVCGSTTEVPSTITNFSVPIPTLGDTGAGMGALPASFYLPSKPSWWTSGIPYPPIGPDVTGGNLLNCSSNAGVYGLTNGQCSSFGGSSSNGTAGHVYGNPAMACFLNTMGGSPNGTDAAALTNFSPTTCYAGSSSSGPPLQISGAVKISGGVKLQ